MKEQPKGKVIIIPPEEPETAEQIMQRIFGMSVKEYTEHLIKKKMKKQEEQQEEPTNTKQ